MPRQAIAAVLMATAVLTGCSSGGSGTAATASATLTSGSQSAARTTSPSAARETSPAAVTAAPAESKVDTSGCLFSVEQVSDVLSGRWELRPEPRGCTYISDRGAGFGVTNVGAPSPESLQEARNACVAGVEPMQAAGEGFVCLERRPSGDLVVGNTVARGRLWVVVIIPLSEGIPEPELKAMLALMNAVPVKG